MSNFVTFKANSNNEKLIGYWNTDLHSQEFNKAISNATRRKK